MTSRDQIETRMRDITAFIEQSTQSVRAGKMVTLRHLDDEVAALCDAAVSLPPAEAALVQPMMSAMIARLEELAQSLKDFQQSARGNGA